MQGAVRAGIWGLVTPVYLAHKSSGLLPGSVLVRCLFNSGFAPCFRGAGVVPCVIPALLAVFTAPIPGPGLVNALL